jgi:hypothetical protein
MTIQGFATSVDMNCFIAAAVAVWEWDAAVRSAAA